MTLTKPQRRMLRAIKAHGTARCAGQRYVTLNILKREGLVTDAQGVLRLTARGENVLAMDAATS